jgi:peptidyl-prolyl cis-trans isomerase C
MIARRMIGTYLDQNPVTETELQQAYAESSEQLADTQYRARHILVETEAEAAEIIQQLNDGADFQELARTRSTGPSGPNGGDLGGFTADRMVPPFATAVREMEVGTHSTVPVQTRFGWHVLLLEEKSDARAPDLDAVRGDITNLVEQRKVQEYLDQLRSRALITDE